jgi:hypothetical protein
MGTKKTDMLDRTGATAHSALTKDRRFGEFLADGIDVLLGGGAYDSAPTSTLEYARKLLRLFAYPDEANRVEAKKAVVLGTGDERLREFLAGAIDGALGVRRLVSRYPEETIATARELSALLGKPVDKVVVISGDRSAARFVSVAKGPENLADILFEAASSPGERGGR